ncbi:MAG: SusC/RagA family TonB-linked outer membrane protein [Muribaculaceae bacterium]
MYNLQSNLLKLCLSLLLISGYSASYAATTAPSDVQSPSMQQHDDGTIGGQVVDENGEPVIGATVTVKGTNKATATDIDGNFTLKASKGSKLVVSYLGYTDKEVVADGNAMVISLKESQFQLGEVVVTALGIKRSEKALSYNVQKVGGDNLTTVKSTNFMSSLSGKVAGVNINASSAGMGGATRVVMRGPKSINQSNQALYVIDGVPINNRNNGSSEGIFVDQPGGEGIADINPEDIESVNVLSGPAAAALYGSAAAQGVIMITTKKGAEGKVAVTISHSSQFSSPFKMPEFQNVYPNRPGEIRSWGEKGTSEYTGFDPEEFFNTGSNIQNNVSLTVGNSKNQTYLSVGTTNAQGIIPNNDYNRYNFSFRNTTSFLNDKMTLDVGLNYINQNDCNLMAQGQYFNPLVPLYLFPRGESFDAIRTFEVYDQARGIYVQNWNFGDALQMQNPYWVAERMNRTNNKHRYMANASLKYQIFDWLDVVGRLRWDRTTTKSEDKRYASTINLFAHSDYGFYKYHNIADQSLYGDFMFNVNKTFDNFSIGANVGGSMSRTQYDDNGFQGGLKAPSNIFTPNAIDYASATNDNRPIYAFNKHYINSLFANIELGWRSMLYLTLTGRNDWDSALDGTSNESFFYPSVGLSAIISQMVKLPKAINYLKVRGSWASVGSAISPNITSAWRYGYNPASQSYVTVTYKFPETFYPERTDSWEAGLTARFLDNSLTFDLTFYQSNTRKQTFLRPITVAEGYSSEYVQTGNVRNRGIELSIGYNKTWGDFTWNSNFTYSMNRNKIIDLLDDEDEVINVGGLNGANVILKKGGTMGDVYTYTDFARDREGNIALDASGNVIRETLTNPEYRGSVLPKGNFGFSNDFTWKGINLGFLLTARVGGIVMSQTQAILDYYGVSQRTADAREAGGIPVNTGTVSAESYYSVVGGDNPIWSEYIYSGTNVRLQEAHVGYTIPRKWLKGMDLSLSLTANNLFMIYCKAPFDPESTGSTGTFYQGFDYFMQPSLRSLGFNVKLQF